MKLKIKELTNGRAVNLSENAEIYVGKKYQTWKYPLTGTPSLVGKIPPPIIRKTIQPFRLLCRLLRHELRGFTILKDGHKIAATRQGLHYAEPGQILMKPTSLPKTPLKIKHPMTITIDSEENILWGEYWGNPDLREVRIFASCDKGKSYEPVFEFERGQVRHIHNIIEDPYEQCYWICAGDQEKEPGIGRLSKDFKDFDWLVKGQQKYRTVNLFIFEDKIIYPSDTEKDFNGIYVLDKLTGKIEKLCQTTGSCIYAAKFGKWYAASTTVEYFEKYKNNFATLWVSQDALKWQQVYKAEKDIWSKKYFQFGSIILPRSGWNRDEIVFSGQALKKNDNKVCVAEILE